MTAQMKATWVSDRRRRAVLLAGVLVCLGLSVAWAEPDDPAPAPRAPAAATTPATPAAVVGAPSANSPFATQDRWEHAGYNQDEIVYTVFITNHDANILRCRTEIHGVYFNNGQKGEISDVQVSTVFPAKQVQAGIWSGLDEASGATYKVSCRAL